MSQNLPDGWLQTTIDVVTTRVQQTRPLPQERFFYIDISSINRDTKQILNSQNMTGKDAPSRARQVVATGDVLVSMTRPNLNAVAIVPNELDAQIASTGFDVLRPVGIDARWLYYLVRTENFISSMSSLVQGALYPAIRPKDIRNFTIPIAPLDEQKRIADKLDYLFARVIAGKEHLECVPHILRRFREAILIAGTSGRLTEDWRKEQKIRFAWQKVRFTDVGEIGRGKSKHRPRNDPLLYGGPYPFIQTGDIAQSRGWITSHSQTYNEIGLAQSKLWPAQTSMYYDCC